VNILNKKRQKQLLQSRRYPHSYPFFPGIKQGIGFKRLNLSGYYAFINEIFAQFVM
jgi:hypothetical protein